MAKRSAAPDDPIVIKKYANRRLYNTATSAYVTLEHLCQMVKDGVDFVVYDAKSGEEITRPVLTQIIFEEENKGQHLLPIQFLRQLIRFYGDSLQTMLPSYLEMSMESFARNQEQLRTSMSEALGDLSPFRQFEEMSRQNAAMFQRAMQMFNPFAANPAAANESDGEAQPAEQPSAGADQDDLNDLRRQMADMQRQLDKLSGD